MSTDSKRSKTKGAPVDVVNEDGFSADATTARLTKWYPDLSPETIASLSKYVGEILKFNKAVNLISATTTKTMDAVHIGDSVSAARLIYPALVPNAPLYDFGSGNGLPGIVFAILYPSLKVVLVDRDQRKLEFCKTVVATLKLSNVTTHVGGVEELPAKSVLNAVGRGLAPLPKALIMARKSVAKGGKFFHMKTDAWANELAQVPSQLFSFWRPGLLGQYRINEQSSDMAVVVTDKSAD